MNFETDASIPHAASTDRTTPYSIGVLQTHPTQFDGPFFRKLSQHPDVDFTAYFTRTVPKPDFEIGRNPEWDHGVENGYRSVWNTGGLSGLVKLLRSITANKHDLLILTGYRSSILLATLLVQKLSRRHVGLRSDNILLYENQSGLKWRAKTTLLPLVHSLFDTGHPVGTLSAEYLTRLGFSETQLFRFPYSIDADYLRERCRVAKADRTSLRAELGIGVDDFVLLGIIKFHSREDPLTLLRGYMKLRKEFSNAHLVLVGDGPMRGEITSLIDQNSIPGIYLPGYVPYSELSKFYSLADVFVHPPLTESWGVSVHESLACGVPVVAATTVGSSVDLILPHQVGLNFEAGNPESLFQALRDLIVNPAKVALMAERTQTAIESWNYGHVISSLISAADYARRI